MFEEHADVMILDEDVYLARYGKSDVMSHPIA